MDTINETIQDYFRERGYDEELISIINVSDTGESFDIGSQTWFALTDEEATAEVREMIELSITDFDPEFLARRTRQEKWRFENLTRRDNAEILDLVKRTCGLDEFVSKTIGSLGNRGRGHFLSLHDGMERKTSDDNIFLYRSI